MSRATSPAASAAILGALPRPTSLLLALVGELAELLQWLRADDVVELAG